MKKTTIGETKPHNNQIQLVEYDFHWAELFTKEYRKIQTALGDRGSIKVRVSKKPRKRTQE